MIRLCRSVGVKVLEKLIPYAFVSTVNLVITQVCGKTADLKPPGKENILHLASDY